jgi:hypothetical protein
MTEKKTPKVIFEPGCFDNLDIDQDELDELMAQLLDMAESGELEANSRELTEEDIAEMDPEERELLLKAITGSNESRNLH